MVARAFQKYKAFFYAVSVLCGLIIRAFALPLITGDMQLFWLPWYAFIVNHGGFLALGQNFSINSPPFLYLLAAMTYFRAFIPPVIGIKLISIAFDIAMAVVVHELVRLKYGSGFQSWLAFTAVLLLPTVAMNSSNWGQEDAMYTTFLLLCVYCAASHRPFGAMLFFSIGFAFKFQAIFLIPFLLVLFIKKEIPWRYVVVPPVVYLILALPMVLLGRSLIDVLTIYFQQAGDYNQLSMYAPNLYSFCVASPVTCTASCSTWIAFAITGIAVAAYVFYCVRSRLVLTAYTLLLWALSSVMLMAFFLPRMHERYFYPADVFSLVVAFYRPRLWILPVAIQIASLLGYSGYLFGASPLAPIVGALFNSAAFLYLLVALVKARNTIPTAIASSSAPSSPSSISPS